MNSEIADPVDPLDDLWDIIIDASLNDDGAAAREHLEAGFPIYFVEDDTPEDMVIKKFPDGRKELIRVTLASELATQAAA